MELIGTDPLVCRFSNRENLHKFPICSQSLGALAG